MTGLKTSAVWAWNETMPEKVENCVHVLVREQAKVRLDGVLMLNDINPYILFNI